MLHDDPLWFKDAIIYEVPVRAFADSDGDGIGDFRGLTEKLDYIQDLGVTAIWVLPFFPSPLRDDGYDISDYYSINPIYGNLDDLKDFLEAAHQRGIRVIIELIVNHTSDQHPWFQRAQRSPAGSRERDFYVWSDTPEKYPDVRIIFKDFETSNWAWDPVAKAYYWHRFYSHQPDLNYESPDVQQAVLDVVDFWLELGVDGLRLDAVPYLYEQEGTNCENLPRTHEFLKTLRSHMDMKFPNRMLLAEANQWPEDAVQYYGEGDECHMDFHFPLMPRLFMSIRMEDSFPIIDILQQTPAIPDNCQWALFLRNHDELTLEMVSDEDRDYMYRVYAQDPQARINLGIRRRLAPLMGSNRRRIELMNSLLMSLPGTPVLYYGDEIGMGDNIYLGDRNGVRTPMQWSADRNAGFSRANPQRLYAPIIVDPEYHYEAVNVEAQRENPNSLWWWMKRLIATRARYKAFGRGTFEFLYPANRKVLAFLRMYDGEHVLVVANLSRFVQAVELDLEAFHGMVPVEIFGRVEFPKITEAPYFLSLGPHAFYWFTLQLKETPVPTVPQPQWKTLSVSPSWDAVFTKADAKLALEAVLPSYLLRSSWFAGRTRIIQAVQIQDVMALPRNSTAEVEPQSGYYLTVLDVNYTEGLPEHYALVVSYVDDAGDGIPPSSPESAIAKLRTPQGNGWLVDAMTDSAFLTLPLKAIARSTRVRGMMGELIASQTEVFEPLSSDFLSDGMTLTPHMLRGSHSNTLVVYGDRLILKLFRRFEAGANPDLEIGRFLTHSSATQGLPSPEHCVPVAGALEYQRRGTDSMTVGILYKYIPDTRDAWSYTLDTLRDAFERILVKQLDVEYPDLPPISLSAALQAPIPEIAYTVMGSFLNEAELLGQRTAELHIALASDLIDPAFQPEAFSSFYQRSIYQYMRNLSGQVLITLKNQLPQLPDTLRPTAKTVLSYQEMLMDRFKRVLDYKITGLRIRCHGDYHLGQVLFTGKDFIMIDFEGDPNRSLGERRMKRSPLRDVAGMLNSFYRASRVALQNELETGLIRPDSQSVMNHWAQFMSGWAGVVFLKQYLAIAGSAQFLPDTTDEQQVLLAAYMLEKTIQDLGVALESPTFLNLNIPLMHIVEQLDFPALH